MATTTWRLWGATTLGEIPLAADLAKPDTAWGTEAATATDGVTTPLVADTGEPQEPAISEAAAMVTTLNLVRLAPTETTGMAVAVETSAAPLEAASAPSPRRVHVRTSGSLMDSQGALEALEVAPQMTPVALQPRRMQGSSPNPINPARKAGPKTAIERALGMPFHFQRASPVGNGMTADNPPRKRQHPGKRPNPIDPIVARMETLLDRVSLTDRLATKPPRAHPVEEARHAHLHRRPRHPDKVHHGSLPAVRVGVAESPTQF